MGWRPLQKAFRKWSILRGDKVVITAGKDKGLTGTVQKVLRDENRVIVGGRNLIKKSVKKTETRAGGFVTIEASMHVSNVALIDPVTGAPCRVASVTQADGTRVRVSRGGSASGSIIPKPPPNVTPKGLVLEDSPKCTLEAAARRVTYNHLTGEGGLPPVMLVDGVWKLAVDLPDYIQNQRKPLPRRVIRNILKREEEAGAPT